jgi:membrane associated rhomboid family serine protease
MGTVYKRSISSYIPGYSKNAVLQLIIYSGTAYVVYNLIWAIMVPMLRYDQISFDEHFTGNLALPALSVFKLKFWTLLTYGWFSTGFWNLVSNMVWLYCFGSLVQIMIGYKQIIPVFIYSLIAGGIFYMLCQFIPGRAFEVNTPLFGPQAGLMGLAIASLTITPNYRFFLTDRFSLPLALVVGIFAVLMIVYTHGQLSLLLLLAGGGLMGFAYVKLLRSGYKPGEWMYDLYGRLEQTVTPDERINRQKNNKRRSQILNKIYEPKQDITQKRIDDILDKINHKGYKSLSQEEKEILLRAGKEN